MRHRPLSVNQRRESVFCVHHGDAGVAQAFSRQKFSKRVGMSRKKPPQLLADDPSRAIRSISVDHCNAAAVTAPDAAVVEADKLAQSFRYSVVVKIDGPGLIHSAGLPSSMGRAVPPHRTQSCSI